MTCNDFWWNVGKNSKFLITFNQRSTSFETNDFLCWMKWNAIFFITKLSVKNKFGRSGSVRSVDGGLFTQSNEWKTERFNVQRREKLGSNYVKTVLTLRLSDWHNELNLWPKWIRIVLERKFNCHRNIILTFIYPVLRYELHTGAR